MNEPRPLKYPCKCGGEIYGALTRGEKVCFCCDQCCSNHGCEDANLYSEYAEILKTNKATKDAEITSLKTAIRLIQQKIDELESWR